MKRSIGIVGAGVCGATCARALLTAGHSVNVFDKGRGPGGRLSSRRGEAGQRFDHGAYRLDVTHPAFHDMLSPAVAQRVLCRDGETYTSPTGMNALCNWLLDGVPAQYASKCVGLERAGLGRAFSWTILDEAGVRHGPFDLILLAIPPANVAELVQGDLPELAARVSGIHMMPRWVAMLGFATKLNALPDDTLIDGHTLRRSMSNAVGDAFVIQASPTWSADHVELDPGDAADRLLKITAPLLGPASPTSLSAHRWRYAFADRPLGMPFLHDEQGVYICGDWCVGRSIEAAWHSATAVVDAINAIA